MDRSGSKSNLYLVIVAVTLWAAVPAGGQLVPIRTVPVARGDQFWLSPSDVRGMGGLSVAIEDTLGASFRNPGATLRLREGLFFGSPVHYSIADAFSPGGHGGGTSLPLGVLLRGDRWSAGGFLALQELRPAEESGGFPVPFFDDCELCRFTTQVPIEPTLAERSARNVYLHGQVARSLAGGAGGVGLSVSLAQLNWVAGVEHLYSGSQRIDPSGSVLDLRAGLLLETPGDGVLEVVLVHNRVDMTHDVTYVDWSVPRLPPDSVPALAVVVEPSLRIDENRDVTRTWGGYVRYARPIGESGWRAGWSLTANRGSHPSIPNYEIQNIPRDPGRSWAFDLGAGLARREGPVRFGVEAVLEPIWAETWQSAGADTVTAGGIKIRRGEHTIDNDFTFTNVILRTGLGADWGDAGFQLGVEARSIGYDLRQVDRLAVTIRDQNETWMEWVPTWGASYRFASVTLRYVGTTTTGTGRPGIANSWTFEGVPRATLADASGALGILAAPAGPLTLQAATVWAHQISVVVPIG